MIRCCEGRIAKDENLTFGDGKTKFYAEGQCSAQILVTDNQTLCVTCRIEGHGKITEPFPANSRIFGPTAWFLETWKRCGAPSRDTLKKAMEAQTKVAASVSSMARKKQNSTEATQQPTQPTQPTQSTQPVQSVQPTPLQIRYYQTDQTIQLANIEEGHKLKSTTVKNRKLYKDPITGLLFDRTKDGRFIPVWVPVVVAVEQ